jgi:hypothetical protein
VEKAIINRSATVHTKVRDLLLLNLKSMRKKMYGFVSANGRKINHTAMERIGRYKNQPGEPAVFYNV